MSNLLLYFQFRGVVPPITINYAEYLNKDNVSYEHLVKKAKGVFFNEKIPLTNEDKEAHLRSILRENSITISSDEEDWRIAVNAFDELVCNSNDGRVYFRDIESVPEECHSILSSFTSPISVNENKEIRKMPGINTPMHYVGGKLSYTIHHEEDGGLSSLNILKAGSPKAWFIIDNRFRADVEKKFADHLKKECASETICFQVLKHKIYFITPLLLDQWKIPYTFVLQKPGDLFFIGRAPITQ